MSDIVERLKHAHHDERLSCGALYAEAAAEIERLRAEIEARKHSEAVDKITIQDLRDRLKRVEAALTTEASRDLHERGAVIAEAIAIIREVSHE